MDPASATALSCPARYFAAPIYHKTVEGLGYVLVDVERLPGGLLRVTIEHPVIDDQTQAVTVADCERVTRQLQFVLEVERVDYKRLEVSSPGVDRPLRGPADLQRFVGSRISVTLKTALTLQDEHGKSAGKRRRFSGYLERAAADWQISWAEEPARKPGARRSLHAQPLPLQHLRFAWHELQEARLAPVLNFKGRSVAPTAAIGKE